jgi:hypothetical protein
MKWLPDIAGDLPAPRDDEPSSLRQDIVDELADHLHSSFNRELHFTPEESSAKHNVLDRFGDPRRIARQLWFDAMKEKIVSQRVQIGALVVAIAACLGSTGLTWLLITQTREANQALLEQSQKVNAALLEKLGALAASTTSEPARSMEWNPVRIRLVKDAAGGPPVAGFDVRIEGHILDTAEFMTVTRTTGADGVADFGLVRPGQHAIEVDAPWMDWYRDDRVIVLPGKELNMELVCPAAPRDEAPVTFSVEWPEEYRESGLWLACEATLANRQIDGATWNNKPSKGRRYFIISRANDVIALPENLAETAFQIMARDPGEQPDPFFNVTSDMLTFGVQVFPNDRQIKPRFTEWWPGMGGFPRPAVAAGQPPPPFRPVHLEIAKVAPIRELRWPVGPYKIENLVVCEPPTDGRIPDIWNLNVVGGLVAVAFHRFGQFPAYEAFSDWVDKADANVSTRADDAIDEQRAEQRPKFELLGGRRNHWTIEPPPRLLEMMRRFSKECDVAGRQMEATQRQQDEQLRRQTGQTVKPATE